MDKDFYPQLCGGVFFSFLLESRVRRASARVKRAEGTDGLAEYQMLAGLIKVFYPGFKMPDGRSLSTETARYKKCIKSYSVNMPFDDNALIMEFDKLVKNHYTKAVARMKVFSDDFLERTTDIKIDYALSAIITTIEADETIVKDQLFYVQPNGNPITKGELCGLATVYTEPFLLGIWHFIITQRNNNLVGVDTIDQWLPKFGYSFRDEGKINFDRDTLVHGERYIIPGSNQNDFVEINECEVNESFDFTPYLQATKTKFSELKTLLYNDKPRKFYDFYVCNHIYPRRFLHHGPSLQPDIVSLTSGFRGSSHVVITGSGGLGKSMMMRHLLLDAIDNYSSTKLVPIFVPLKDYGAKYTDIFEYIFECLKKNCKVKKGQLEKSLEYGEIVLLLDGLDEIKTELVNDYKNELDKFIDDYPNTRIIMSSRPFEDFVEFRTFTILELQPFNKEQALELIKKLEFRPDEPDFKEKFRKELEARLYITHREFANNPLLLTIMLMTFEQFAEIPSKMHVFYREAYLALSQKHDASKGGYKRELKTKLSADRFSDYLSEFCMRTYHDEKFELTHEEFVKYFSSLKEKTRVPGEIVAADDFLIDLKSGMCILYYESGKYHFTHRSFQEYFCALFFSKQKDKTLGRIGDFFEQREQRMHGDMTFNMLYDMIPDHVEEYILLPYLTNFFKKCDAEEGYWTYLKENYDYISYDIGVVNGSEINAPSSFLMQFVTKQLPNKTDYNSELPFYSEFVITKYVEIEFKRGKGRAEIVDEEFAASIEDEAEIINDDMGYNLSADIEMILGDRDNYADMIEALNDENYELKIEYNAVRDYWEQLKKKQIPLSDDFFDIF